MKSSFRKFSRLGEGGGDFIEVDSIGNEVVIIWGEVFLKFLLPYHLISLHEPMERRHPIGQIEKGGGLFPITKMFSVDWLNLGWAVVLGRVF